MDKDNETPMLPKGSQDDMHSLHPKDWVSPHEEIMAPKILTLAEVEKSHILKSLSYFNGNKTKASASLGITIKTLYNKLHEYGMMTKKGKE